MPSHGMGQLSPATVGRLSILRPSKCIQRLILQLRGWRMGSFQDPSPCPPLSQATQVLHGGCVGVSLPPQASLTASWPSGLVLQPILIVSFPALLMTR